MKNLLDLNLDELKDELVSIGESAFRAKQIFSWIYKGVFDFNGMKNIPKSLSSKLQEHFFVGVPEVLEEFVSGDGTRKLLVSLQDGNLIECVIMKYLHGNTICISTQVGCRMGCKFCASTLGGVVRNITPGEMIGQILLAQKIMGERISNVVLMGSGEPLDNFDNVMKFLELVNAEYGLNIGQRHITLSTCGIVPKIYELADKNLSITLAISLHAFSDEKRREIMPIANKYSIKEILDACDYYIKKTNRRVTFEYSLVKGINDSKEDSRSLARLLKGILCHVNLIPVNEIKEKEYKKSSKEDVRNFEEILKSYGIEATVRKEMGSDINAACGQLRRSYLETRDSN
ncbi:MAG: 23S rRNA (adenine(2503)-C(2))-methyltransferase RlmN [Clostridiaceae bacterium]